MSKKRKTNRTTRSRHAARRAARRARTAERRRIERGGRPARSNRRGPPQSVTVTPEGFVAVNEVPEADVEAHLAYIEAHRLLPPGFPTSEEDRRTRMTMALFTLDDPEASSDAVLRAIMILGHTPDDRALTALARYAGRGGVHADLAKQAADECAMWLESGALAPPPRASNMMN